ncbi:MAG: hypothetical protein Q8882_08255, partial [Bacillota bacterium]|nr:hypothetical protein [Bacillota bacterium]
MSILVKQVSSMEKVRLNDNFDNLKVINSKRVFKGERFSYQITARSEETDSSYSAWLDSPLKDYIKIYTVKNSVMDFPTYVKWAEDDYISKEPGLMPDMLMPIEDSGNMIKIPRFYNISLWICVDVPENINPGNYDINIKLTDIERTFRTPKEYEDEPFTIAETMHIEIVDKVLPAPGIKVTQWFHTDCIASAHNVKIYSKKHSELIDKYIQAAVYIGINMILMPLISPPLDTAFKTSRPNVQL